ncbi:DUF2189 domain-containing protein [Sulfitobacter guttiformis]|uniref:Putative membrane protein n=1 Tax=Sulfitobacter guttiformis TaxID=74349 RepID=A0A420DJE4_9RHOB|nr:DUF2189 domain-containing protein [Sulfitobacter guttiformis]KIN71825.1 putative transmembrane protein [Sulfitobacter guttiformis KCTC 32187]RKE94360.1 putative membrane protein [Sulfitobacter guttiformis]
MLSDHTNNSDNPPKPDSHEAADVIPGVVPALPVENRRARNLPWQTAFAWLRAGWSDLWNNPVPSLLYGFGIFAASALIVWALFLFNYEYALFPALAGFMVVGPMIANGLYEKSRMLEECEQPTFLRMLFVQPKSGYQAWFMGVLLLLLMLLWLRAAVLIWALFFGIVPFPGTDEIVPMLFTTPIGWVVLLVGGSVGALFAAFSFAISVFAMPMLLTERTDALSALGISMALVWNNLSVMLAWGMIVLVLFLASVATAFVGLIVVFPVLGHATWHAYRAIRSADHQNGETENMFIRPA